MEDDANIKFEKFLKTFLNEIREEQHISPFRQDSEFIPYIKDGIYDINDYCGTNIDYDVDLKARRL